VAADQATPSDLVNSCLEHDAPVLHVDDLAKRGKGRGTKG